MDIKNRQANRHSSTNLSKSFHNENVRKEINKETKFLLFLEID